MIMQDHADRQHFLRREKVAIGSQYRGDWQLNAVRCLPPGTHLHVEKPWTETIAKMTNTVIGIIRGN